jgi:hypothetical protein
MKGKIALLLIFFFFLSYPSIEASEEVPNSHAKKHSLDTPEERLRRLRSGEILTDGGYLKKGAWGKMEGVVQVPPKVVWRLFLQSNEWRRYGLPNLADSRAVTEEIARSVEDSKKVDDFYKILGGQVFDPIKDQKKGVVWTNYAFQYYDFPWPLANKWMVLKNSQDETRAPEDVYRSSWVKVAGNVQTVNGSVSLEPFDNDPNLTLFKYHVESDPGSAVPKFLLKWGVKKTMPAALNVIRREAAKVYGRPTPLLKTQ